MNEDEIMRRNVRQGFKSNPTIDLERKMKNYVSKMVWYIQKIELFEKKLSLSSRAKIFVLFFFDVQMNKQDSKFAGSKVKLIQKNVRLLFNLIQVIF